MDDLGSREVRSLNALNYSRLRMIWTIFGRGPMTLNVMNESGIWMTWPTQGHELSALDVMNNSGLWMTRTIPRHELRALNGMNISRLWLICMSWAHGFGSNELLGVVNDMNDLRSYKLKPLGAMNSSWLGWYQRFLVMSPRLLMLWTTKGCGWHEQLKVVSLRLWMLWIA